MATTAPARVIHELLRLARASASSARLDRVLAGVDVPAAAKKSLIGDLGVGSACADAAVEALSVSRGRASQALVDAALSKALEGNEESAKKLEVGLVTLATSIQDHPELAQALTDRSVDSDAKARLLVDVFADKVDEVALDLVIGYVYLRHGLGVAATALDAAQKVAARRGATLVDIKTAIELDDDRKQLLIQALQQSIGTSIQPHFAVDASILGSVVVRVGDEVMDGSVQRRLDQARKALVS